MNNEEIFTVQTDIHWIGPRAEASNGDEFSSASIALTSPTSWWLRCYERLLFLGQLCVHTEHRPVIMWWTHGDFAVKLTPMNEFYFRLSTFKIRRASTASSKNTVWSVWICIIATLVIRSCKHWFLIIGRYLGHRMEPENEWWHPRHEPTSITIFRLGVGVEAISSESREWMEQWNAIKLRKLCNILISSELRHERSICAINVTSPKPLKTVTWNPLIATWDDATRSGLRMQFAWQHSNSMMKAATLVALSSPSCGMLRKDKWNNFLCKTRTEMRRWRRNSEEMMLQSA